MVDSDFTEAIDDRFVELRELTNELVIFIRRLESYVDLEQNERLSEF